MLRLRHLLISRPLRSSLWLALATSGVFALTASSGRADDAAAVVNRFRDHVAPLLSSRCVRCHSGDEPAGSLSLTTPTALNELGYVVPGRPEESLLLDVIIAAEGELKPSMPKDGTPLSEAEVESIRQWIADGAVWPDGIVLEVASNIDRNWWSLQPIVASDPPPLPEGMPASWNDNPIDRFIAAKLAEQGLSPNPPADRRTLIRRVTYDLTGLPPTPEEVEAFENDESPDAYERLVDRLLASPHYGEHWGRHWLDVVRFGESNGYERNVILNSLWPYRDYVIRSFNDDKPFDQFVREQLAGDVLAPNDPDVAVGTTFLVCGPYDNVGNQDAAQAAIIRANTIDEIIRASSEAFLGMTVGCARCHDHKFDPILQADYYTLYSIFAGVQHGERQVGTPEAQAQREAAIQPLTAARDEAQRQRDVLQAQVDARAEQVAASIEVAWARPPVSRYLTEESFEPIEAKAVRLTALNRDTDPNGDTGFRIDEFEVFNSSDENVALASTGATAEGASRVAQDFAHAYGPDLAIDGRYGAQWLATGNTLTITFAAPQVVQRAAWSSDRQQLLEPNHAQTTCVGDYRLEVSLDGITWTKIADSTDRQPPSPAHRLHRLREVVITAEERTQLATIDAEIVRLNGEIAAVPMLPTWWIGQFQPAPGPFPLFLGGDPQRPGEMIDDAELLLLDPLRTEMAFTPQLTEAERRMKLADWIVSDSNPLTSRVLANRLWHYHFGTGLVGTPSDFGQMGSLPSHPELLDWLAMQVRSNGWKQKPLHRMILLTQTYRQSSDHRADAAAIDASARLFWRFPPRRLTGEELRDSMLSVAGVLDLEASGGPGFRLYQYLEDNVATYVPLDIVGPETYRRAVYHQNARAARVDVMSDFDCPDPAFSAPSRPSTTTPLQALTLLNHQFTLDMADGLAIRLRLEGGSESVSQVARAWHLLFAREPDAEELAHATEFLEQAGLTTFCRAMLNSNEFLYVD